MDTCSPLMLINFRIKTNNKPIISLGITAVVVAPRTEPNKQAIPPTSLVCRHSPGTHSVRELANRTERKVTCRSNLRSEAWRFVLGRVSREPHHAHQHRDGSIYLILFEILTLVHHSKLTGYQSFIPHNHKDSLRRDGTF